MSKFDPYARQIFVDNNYLVSEASQHHQVLNPADHKHEGTIASCSASEVEAVILRAKEAQQSWKVQDEKTRSHVLHQLANSIEQSDFKEVAKLMVLEEANPTPRHLESWQTARRFFATTQKWLAMKPDYCRVPPRGVPSSLLNIFPMGCLPISCPLTFQLL